MLHSLTAKTGLVAGIAVVDSENDVMIITDDGVIIRTGVEEIRECGRGSQGVIVMRTGADVKVISIAARTRRKRTKRRRKAPGSPLRPPKRRRTAHKIISGNLFSGIREHLSVERCSFCFDIETCYGLTMQRRKRKIENSMNAGAKSGKSQSGGRRLKGDSSIEKANFKRCFSRCNAAFACLCGGKRRIGQYGRMPPSRRLLRRRASSSCSPPTRRSPARTAIRLRRSSKAAWTRSATRITR